MKNEPTKRLSDITREESTKRVNKFADSLMPALPKSKSPVEEPSLAADNQPEPLEVSAEVPQTMSAPVATVTAPTKSERIRKSAGFSVDDVVNGPGKEGDGFNKMVRVTDEHHELLRLMAFRYRKPMNVLVHNLIVLLDQTYQKEQKGGQSDV